MKDIKNIFYYLILSILAIILILIMVFLTPTTNNTIFLVDKLFLAVAFFTSCIFGISIAIYPNWWRKNKAEINHISGLQSFKKIKSFKGHHPDCNMFKSHIIIIKNKPRCAGCLGLIIGALASIFLITLYIVIPIKFFIYTYYILLILGILMIIFIYAEIILLKRRMVFHILLNSLLVISFFFITISVVELTENLIYGILTIILCFLLLDTRIHFSKYQHKRICASCKQSCKSFF